MVSILTQTGQNIVNPLFSLWNSFIKALPGLIGAFIILIVGYLVAIIVASGVKKLLDKTKLMKWIVKQTKTTQLLGKVDLTYFFATIVKWYVFILFLNPAADITNLKALSGFFMQLAIWIPSLIAAVVIGLLGFLFAMYVGEAILKTKAAGSKIMAELIKTVIIVFTVIIALSQLGVNVILAQNTFLIVLSGAVFAISLALGIGFGLGMKDEAKLAVTKLRKRL